MFNFLITREQNVDGWNFNLFNPENNNKIGKIEIKWNSDYKDYHIWFIDFRDGRKQQCWRDINNNDWVSMYQDIRDFYKYELRSISIISIYILRTLGVDC